MKYQVVGVMSAFLDWAMSAFLDWAKCALVSGRDGTTLRRNPDWVRRTLEERDNGGYIRFTCLRGKAIVKGDHHSHVYKLVDMRGDDDAIRRLSSDICHWANIQEHGFAITLTVPKELKHLYSEALLSEYRANGMA